MGRPAVFLDRDGTINVEKDYLYEVDRFEYLSGVLEGLRYFQDKGYILIVVTNQSGIARGYYTEEDFLKLNRWMSEDLRQKGIVISGTYYCPHLPDAPVEQYRRVCNCRKPGTELYLMAQRDFDVDMKNSIAIGDRLRDISVCDKFGMRGYLLADRYRQKLPKAVTICENWEEIIKRELHDD